MEWAGEAESPHAKRGQGVRAVAPRERWARRLGGQSSAGRRTVTGMGAFKVEVMLHDDEVLAFVRQALNDELTSQARYVALRMVDEVPELAPEGYVPA